jgi:hypothetical protein
MTTEPTPIRTEDGATVHAGDQVFDYYDMLPGVIAEEPDPQGWFDVVHPDGSKHMLDGSRICSVEYARRKGWLP